MLEHVTVDDIPDAMACVPAAHFRMGAIICMKNDWKRIFAFG